MPSLSNPDRATGPTGRRRRAEGTRRRLLQATFDLTYRQGFQATSLDTILARARVTKGAMYHHFGSKSALGHAMIDEVLRGWIERQWIEPLAGADDPVKALVDLASWGEHRVTDARLALGCPLNNLIQEMAPLDERMRVLLESILEAWRRCIATSLERGQARGVVDPGVDPREAAWFVVACWEGSVSLAKGTRDRRTLGACRAGLERYLETLRPSSPELTAMQ